VEIKRKFGLVETSREILVQLSFRHWAAASDQSSCLNSTSSHPIKLLAHHWQPVQTAEGGMNNGEPGNRWNATGTPVACLIMARRDVCLCPYRLSLTRSSQSCGNIVDCGSSGHLSKTPERGVASDPRRKVWNFFAN
jgi:hypothetical protein